MAYDVCVCFAYHDKEMAEEIWDGLELRGFRCFNEHPYDDAQPGESWEQVLYRGIENSRVVVLVFSLVASRSQDVRDELEHAAEHNIPIIPFMVEAAAPFYMDVFSPSIEWIDAIAPPIEQHIDRLTDEIQALLVEPPPKPVNNDTAQHGAAGGERGEDIHVRLTLTPSEAKYGLCQIRISDDRRLNIQIPPDATDGTKLRLRGEGHASPGGNGDVIVEILIR